MRHITRKECSPEDLEIKAHSFFYKMVTVKSCIEAEGEFDDIMNILSVRFFYLINGIGKMKYEDLIILSVLQPA